MSVIVLPLSDAVAQGSGCAHDAKIASALDNYRVAWVVSKGRLGAEGERGTLDSPGTYWERVTDEAHDGVDSLRSGAIGDNEHVELTTRIEGPATLRFWWKVDSQEHADFMTFAAVTENEVKTSGQSFQERRISGEQGWTKVQVSLPLPTDYRARWRYERDGSGRAGADAGWIDEVRVEGPGYGEIQMDYETEGDLVTLSWPTLPCRHYQVEWRPTNDSLDWQGMISEVKPATGAGDSLLERPILHAKRKYRVTLIEPPSFIRTPRRDFAEKEGDSLTLKYEAEGSGTIKYSWKFRATNNDRPERLPIPEDGREIVSAGKGSTLRINSLTEAHEGEYILVAENEAGREPAPPVSVAVFQPPRLEVFVVREGEEPERRIAMDDPGAPSPPGLSVNAGESLEIEPEVTGSGSIGAKWERQDPRSGEWQLLTEGPDLGLRIGRVTPEDGGQYRVTLTSSMREREGPHVVAVTVISPPTNLCVRAGSDECLMEGSKHEVDQFDPLTLTVEAEGTSAFTYQWFVDNKPIPEVDGGKAASLTVSTEHGGVYHYKAAVGNKATQNVHTEPLEIIVNAPPTILKVVVDEDQEIQDGTRILTQQFNPLTLSVYVEGMPRKFSYQWYRDASVVPEREGGNSKAVTVSTDHVGTFTYYANVTNSIGKDTTSSYEIAVSLCPSHVFAEHHELPPSSPIDCSLSAGLSQQRNSTEPWEVFSLSLAHMALGDASNAIRTAERITDDGYEFAANIYLSQWLARAGDYPKALDKASEISSPYFRAHYLVDIASTQARDALLGPANDTIKIAMESVRQIRDADLADEAIRAVASAQAEIGDVEGASASIAAIASREVRDTTLAQVADKLRAVGNYAKAYRIIQQISDLGLRVGSMSDLVAKMARRGEEDEAIIMLDLATSLAKTIEDKREKAHAISFVGGAQAALGDHTEAKDSFRRAIEWAKQIDSATTKVRTLAFIGSLQDDVDYSLDAKATFAIAMGFAVDIRDVPKQAKNLSEIAVAQARLGDIAGALRTLARRSRELPQNATLRQSVENSINRALYFICRAQVEAGHLLDAQETMAQISSGSRRIWALAELGVAQAAVGDETGARTAFSQAINIVKNTRGDEQRRSAFQSLIEELIGAGHIRVVLKMTNESFGGANYYRDVAVQIMKNIYDQRVVVRDVEGTIGAARQVRAGSTRTAMLAAVAALIGNAVW